MARDSINRALFRVFVPINRAVYEWTGGAVGGRVRGAPILLLRTVGRRSGKARTTPLLYLAEGDRLVVVASAGGAPRHPAWFLNLMAHPDSEVQVRRERRPVRAREATPPERVELWPRLVALYADYDDYQRRTEREIPVVILDPRAQ